MRTISANEIKQGDLIQYVDDRGATSQVEAWNVERCTDCVHVFDFLVHVAHFSVVVQRRGVRVMKHTVIAKLGPMRKAREWSVMPVEGGERIIVQTDGAIGIFGWRTGFGQLCTRGGYYPHLAIARPYAFPPDFVRACLAACPSLGGQTVIGEGVAVIEHTVRVLR